MVLGSLEFIILTRASDRLGRKIKSDVFFLEKKSMPWTWLLPGEWGITSGAKLKE
jgi:hypothetical protein